MKITKRETILVNAGLRNYLFVRLTAISSVEIALWDERWTKTFTQTEPR